jgi:hypothetical protein
MKSFSFFILLNVLNFFAYAYAQDQEITCEQNFDLQGKTCTPCQQALFKHKVNIIFGQANQQLPDKCDIFGLYVKYSFENTVDIVTPAETTKKVVKENIENTCAEAAACNESDAKSAYTEIDKACDEELNQYYSVEGTAKEAPPLNNAGLLAEEGITKYYAAIPLRDIFCSKVEGGKLLNINLIISFA